MLRNTRESYGLLAKFFHWVLALLVISAFILGLYMKGLSLSPDKIRLYGIHKSIGSIILLLVSLRLIWRFTNPIPELPVSLSAIEKFGAVIAHYILYLMMFIMPLSGWMMSSASGMPVSVFGFFTLPNLVLPDKELKNLFWDIHNITSNLMIILITLHILAALKHHFVNRDNVLKRMLPW